MHAFTQSLCTQTESETRSIFKWVQMIWIQFSFSYTGSHTKVKKPHLPYYLFIAGEA